MMEYSGTFVEKSPRFAEGYLSSLRGVAIRLRMRILWLSILYLSATIVMLLLTSQLVETTPTQKFANPTYLLSIKIILAATPIVSGLFFGCPLFASEFESSTYKFMFTQSVGRKNIILASLSLVGAVQAMWSVLLTIYLSHFRNEVRNVFTLSRWSISTVLLDGWVYLLLNVLIFSVCLLAGVIVKRVLNAMAIGLLFIVSIIFLIKTSLDASVHFFSDRSQSGLPDSLELYKFINGNNPLGYSHFHFYLCACISILYLAALYGSYALTKPSKERLIEMFHRFRPR